MKILAMDTSGGAVSVAAYEEQLLGEIYYDIGLTHTETLLPLVELLLARVGWATTELGGIAVAAGPGSFTGLRIGMASAKGMADALQIPIATVNTLAALAFPYRATAHIVCPVMDARRQEVYGAIYHGKTERMAPVAIPLAELLERVASMNAAPIFLGDGVLAYRAQILADCPGALFAPSAMLLQRASMVAQMAAENGEFLPAPAAEIEYLRKYNAKTLAERKG